MLMSLDPRPGRSLRSTALFTPPDHPVEEARDLVNHAFGLDADLVALSGERDQNFLVIQDASRRAILKISNPDEPHNYADFQSALLEHLQNSPLNLVTPQVIRTRQGEQYTVWKFKNGQTSAVRMVTYLEGSQVSQPGVSVADWARKIGVLQGKLCCALADFEHPGASEFMPWNAMSPQLFDDQFLAGLGADLSALIAPHLERLEQDSFPRLQNMPTQVIHNDMHAGNILLNDAGSISGVIDFGDAIRGPVVQELAVSCTSLVEALSHAAFVPVQELIAGFCQEYPLDSEALNLLHDAMIMRSILSVGLGRAKDETVPLEERPRPATKASEAGLRTLLEMRLALSEATMDLRHLQ